MKKCLNLTLLLFFLILSLPNQSHAYFLQNFRKLAKSHRISQETDQISPSPSPVPSLDSESAVNAPMTETCDMVFHKCDIKDFNIIACVPFVGNGSQASYALVQNVGDNSLQYNLTVLPVQISMTNITISGHQVNKVKLPSKMGGSSSVLLKVGSGECTIQLGASIPDSYASYITPINGTYLLFVTILFIGGTWACCKLSKRGRHLKGVPYQELEMSQQEKVDPTFTIESPEGWNDDWDDDWDEEKAVKSPGINHTAKTLENGGSLKYVDTAQWGNDWDD